MLKQIGSKDRIPEIVKRARDPKDDFRLMGFGHRVYKNYDPRAKVMQKTCYEVLNELGMKNNPLLETAMELERVALQDDYFIQKKLYPNVDFYSGIILQAMGFPTSMFTAIFALARTVGWIAQWKEMIEDPAQKIGRPRQLYTGATKRPMSPSLSAVGVVAVAPRQPRSEAPALPLTHGDSAARQRQPRAKARHGSSVPRWLSPSPSISSLVLWLGLRTGSATRAARYRARAASRLLASVFPPPRPGAERWSRVP